MVVDSYGVVLEHFYQGKLVEDEKSIAGFTITAHSTGITVEEAREYFRYASFGSFNQLELEALTSGVGLLPTRDERVMLAVHTYRARFKNRGHAYPDYHVVIVPLDIVEWVAGDVERLLAEVFQRDLHKRPVWETVTRLDSIRLSLPPRLTVEQRTQSLGHFMTLLPAAFDIGTALAAVLSPAGLSVHGLPPHADGLRRGITNGLRLLLPPLVRSRLTYATHVFDAVSVPNARLRLLYPGVEPVESQNNWKWEQEVVLTSGYSNAYASVVDRLLSRDLGSALDVIENALNARLERNLRRYGWEEALAVAARGWQIHEAFQAEQTGPADLFWALDHDMSLSREDSRAYWHELLQQVGAWEMAVFTSHLFDPSYRLTEANLHDDLLAEIFAELARMALYDAQAGVEFFEAACRQLLMDDERYKRMLPRFSLLAGAYTPGEWQRRASGSDDLMLSVTQLALAVRDTALAMHLLSTVELRAVAANHPGLREIARLLHSLVKETEWRDREANEQLGRLWLHGAVDLPVNERLYLLNAPGPGHRRLVFDKIVRLARDRSTSEAQMLDLLDRVLQAYRAALQEPEQPVE